MAAKRISSIAPSEFPPSGGAPNGYRPRLAIVGTGISGLSVAWALSRRFDITLFEKNDYAGGHTHTVEVDAPGGPIGLDTGFIVFNEENYPNLTRLFEQLGVATDPTRMHFSVSVRDCDMEYASHSVSGLFADLRNLTRPRFFSMIADILRFYAEAGELAHSQSDLPLGEFLRQRRYSRSFIDNHLLPMAAAIWSCPIRTMLDYPVQSLARFFVNHGLSQIGGRCRWRTVSGGSRSYIEPLTAAFADRIRLGQEVVEVRRRSGAVDLRTRLGESLSFDHVVLACHGPQALALLADACPRERRVLKTFRTQPNRAVLHTDARLMPRRQRAWASWNYLSERRGEHDLSVTYWLNSLQRLPTARNYFVTLNPAREPAPESVLGEYRYEHPIFDSQTMKAQSEIWSLQGKGGIWYCGAWLGYGFHEDGVQAGLALAERLSNWRRPWIVDPARNRLAGAALRSEKEIAA